MSTYTLTFGPYTDPSFVGMKGTVTLTKPLRKIATGDVVSGATTVTIAADGTASAAGLVYNDDPAFWPTDSQYAVRWDAASWRSSPGNKTFTVPMAAGPVVDFDQLATVATGAGPVTLPVVVSVAGLTGAVTGAQVAGAIAGEPLLKAALVPFWAPGEAVTAGAVRMTADGHTITRNANGTTRGSYDATEAALWTVVSGGGGTGSVTSANITDATTIGKALLTAADAAAERAALGLGSAATQPSSAFDAAGAAAAVLPSKTGNAGKFLTTDGTAVSWGTAGAALPAPGYDIILLAGQSNMTGQTGTGTAAPTTFDPTTERVRAFPQSGSITNQVVLGADPLAHPDTNAAIGVGPGMPFARWYATANPTRRVLLVPFAYGGTGFASSLPNTWSTTAGAGSLYLRAIAAANAAVAAAQAIAPTSKLAAILWLQGENEAWSSWTQSQYATALDALIDGFRSSITTATSSTPFILGRMVPDWIGTSGSLTAPAIDAAHADTPRRKPYTAVINGPVGVNDPGNVFHYLATGQRINGERMFFALAAAQANTGAATVVPDVPQKVALTSGTTSMTLGWLAAISGSAAVTGYEVWRGTASGGETLLTTVSASTFGYTDNTVSAGTTYFYKVRAVSAAGNGAYSPEVSGAPSTVTILAADTFNRADTAATSNASTLGTTDTGAKPWVYRSGYQITISGNKAKLVGATGSSPACVTVDAGQADVDVQATLGSANPGDSEGIVARYVDESNFIYLHVYSATQYELYKVVAGTQTNLIGGSGRIAVAPAVGDRVRLTVKGSTVTAYINGAQAGTATVADAGLASSTLVGLREVGSSFNATFDDFQVTTAP